MDSWSPQQSHHDANFHHFNGHAYDLSSVPMARTCSESTDRTCDSDQTRLSGDTQITYYEEEPVYGCSYFGLEGVSTSQQPESEHYLDTVPVSALEIFSSVIGDVESLARSASEYAMWQLQLNNEPAGTFITFEDISRIVGDFGPEGAERVAIQQIVSEGLWNIFQSADYPHKEAVGVLQEAAHYIQYYAGGPSSPDAFEICRVAILLTLTELKEEFQKQTSFELQQPAQSTQDKSKSTCHEPECKGKSFGRAADLQRHYENVHLPANKRKQFICDYRKCSRHKSAFNRADHFRDHLRDYHREDLVRRSVKPDSGFWQARSKHALFQGWWRCNRCFKRVDTETNGFTCACGQPCELERQKYRLSSEFEYDRQRYLASGKAQHD